MMKKFRFRSFSLLLTGAVLLGCLLPGVLSLHAKAAVYENTYTNTGNQRQDIIGVALTQVGYTEGANNDTKYGTWYGLPNQPWCAMFITWCARQADISTDVLARSAVASPRSNCFDLPYYSGGEYTPQPGDLFFTKDFNHVGLVYYTDGEYFYTLEGNSNSTFSGEGYYVIINRRLIEEYYFGVPDYKGCDKEHSYVKGQDSAHPHKTYYKCQTCGDKYYTSYDVYVAGCKSCLSCGCSASYAGYYLCDVEGGSLNIRTGHGTGYRSLGGVPHDAVVYVHAANPSSGWAYVEYDGLRGHVMLRYLKNITPSPRPPQSPPSRRNTSGTIR